jgi:hypothetical protein
MRNESRTSGSGRGGEKPVAEKRQGACRLLSNLFAPKLALLVQFLIAFAVCWSRGSVEQTSTKVLWHLSCVSGSQRKIQRLQHKYVSRWT